MTTTTISITTPRASWIELALVSRDAISSAYAQRDRDVRSLMVREALADTQRGARSLGITMPELEALRETVAYRQAVALRDTGAYTTEACEQAADSARIDAIYVASLMRDGGLTREQAIAALPTLRGTALDGRETR